MKQSNHRNLWAGIGFLLAFALWTVLIQYVDVRVVGPEETKIGFAAFNVWFHRLTGVHIILYTVTDWLGLIPIGICLGFGVVGLVQLIRRKSLRQVDPDLLLLGLYYMLVILGYLLFEVVPINYRPILIEGRLEASYPSSTTLLVLSVMPTLKLQIDRRSNCVFVKKLTGAYVILFSVFMTIGRLVSGVHWATDIVGATFLSLGLFFIYRHGVGALDQRRKKNYGIQ